MGGVLPGVRRVSARWATARQDQWEDRRGDLGRLHRVSPEDPLYLTWAERLRNKDEYFARQAEAISEARRQRRGAGRAATRMGDEG